MSNDLTLTAAAAAIASGDLSSERLVRNCLDRIEARDPVIRAWAFIDPELALAQARACDKAGERLGPLHGVPIGIKDIIETCDMPTQMGSPIYDGNQTRNDAACVALMRAAGAVITGRTNMVEFAMGAPGTNAHYGTPKNAWDRATGRIPGGSSSGAAVSVTDGMAAAALGTDTAGSVRIPAALCGLAGFKPTARRVPTEGIYPLSRTLDSVGPLAPTVACCALVDAVFAGAAPPELTPRPLQGLRLAVPKYLVFDDVDDTVGAAFQAALSKLSAAGARITKIDFAELARMPAINRIGGFSTAEAYALHRTVLDRAGNQYDQNVAARIRAGEAWTAADYLDLIDIRADMMAAANRISAPFDAIVMPTLPVIACAIADVEDAEAWATTGRLLLRNTLVSNFLDRCALTVPCHDQGAAPVGFTMMGESMGDRRLLEIGLAVEACISPALA